MPETDVGAENGNAHNDGNIKSTVKSHEERQYLDLIKDIMDRGQIRVSFPRFDVVQRKHTSNSNWNDMMGSPTGREQELCHFLHLLPCASHSLT